jgi:hypothetical protein
MQAKRPFEPELTISLPRSGETLGQQFSVFGSCTDINASNNPTITVKVQVGDNVVFSNTAVNNQQRGTYETFFVFNYDPNINGTGKIVVTCDAMPGAVTIYSLTIRPQSALTDTAPAQNNVFTSWTSLVATGHVNVTAARQVWVRLTDAGFDIIGHQRLDVASAEQWTSNIGQLVADTISPPYGSNFNVHVSVWNGNTEEVRISSGSFTVNNG